MDLESAKFEQSPAVLALSEGGVGPLTFRGIAYLSKLFLLNLATKEWIEGFGGSRDGEQAK